MKASQEEHKTNSSLLGNILDISNRINYPISTKVKILSCIWIIFSVVWGWLLINIAIDVYPMMGLFVILLILPIVGGPIILGSVFMLFAIVTSPRWKQPKISCSNSGVYINDSFDISYHQDFIFNTIVETAKFTLIKRENITYLNNNHQVQHESHDVVITQQTFNHLAVSPSRPMNQSISLAIPPNSMHTFNSINNQISWLMHTAIKIPNFPIFEHEYSIRVLSEVRQ